MNSHRSGPRAALAVAVGLAVTGCAAAPAQGPARASAAVAPATPQMLLEGQQVFRTTGRCASCHGPTGQGSSFGPSFTDEEWIWIQPTQPVRPQIATIVRNGIPEPREFGSPMPVMGGAQLTPQQIEAVAAYVESL